MITPEIPTVTAALQALSTRIRTLELRAGPVAPVPVVGAWQQITPEAGYTGTVNCRSEAGSTVVVGLVSGAFSSGSPTFIKIPLGWRAVMPAGTSYYMFRLVAAPAGNAGYISARVWADGVVQMTAVSGTVPSIDLAALRFPNQ